MGSLLNRDMRSIRRNGTVLVGDVAKSATSRDVKPADANDPRLDDGILYPAGHPVTVARFKRAKAAAEGQQPTGELEGRVRVVDRVKPYWCPALGKQIDSLSQRKAEIRKVYERRGVRLEEA